MIKMNGGVSLATIVEALSLHFLAFKLMLKVCNDIPYRTLAIIDVHINMCVEY